MRTSTYFCLLLCLIAALSAAPAGAYTPDINTGPRGTTGIGWASGAVVRYAFNENFAPGNNNELVRAAFRRAFATWMAAMPLQDGRPVVTFEEAGTTSVNVRQCDHINLITFTAAVPSNLVGYVWRWVTPAGFSHFVCSGTGEDIFTPQGEIVEADMLFNPALAFSTDVQGNGNHDIEAVAVHLTGHWLGIAHSGIVGAAMSPACDFWSGARTEAGCTRRLHSDDIAALWAIYSPPGGPTISGTVTDGSGAGIKGAHVVATDASTGLAVASAVTRLNGVYRIRGLPAGAYRVFAEPLDGPVSLSNLVHAFRDSPADFYNDGNSNFVTTFLSNPVTVGSAEAGGVNIRVAAPAGVNLNFIGVGRGAGAYSRASSIPRGSDTSIVLAGTNFSGAVTFSSPGITLSGALGAITTNSSGVQFQTANVHVAATTALGPVNIYYGSSSFTGGLVVTPNPVVPANGVVDGAAFNRDTSPPHFAPGSIISIFGADLAERTAAADRLPLPTELGGISVQVGTRLAPLFFVSPTQINAMIPFETEGTGVALTVIAGSQSASAPVTLALGASAPRVFLAGAQGQGAVLNGSRDNVLADESHPASAGDVLVIFATGLGKVQGDLPTGLPSHGEAARAAVQVTIAGQPAQVQFAGLAPGFVGLDQVNAVVPAGLAAGRVRVLVSTSSGTGNPALISVR